MSSLTVVTNTTTNTALAATDLSPANGWAAHDLAILVVTSADTSGVTGTFAANVNGTQVCEDGTGNAGGKVLGSTINWDVNGAGGNSKFVWIGSVRLDALDASNFYRASTGYGAAGGRKRTWLLRFTPDAPLAARASRLGPTGSGTGTTTGAAYRSLSMSGTADAARKLLAILGFMTASTNAAAADWDGTSTEDTSTATGLTQADEGVLGRIFAVADTDRPTTTPNIHYQSTPGTSWSQAMAVLYADNATNVTAGNATATGTANNATIAISVDAGNATATGTANNPAVTTPSQPHPTSASATGTANDATVKIQPHPTSASATGTANNATVSIFVPAIDTPTETDEAVEVVAWKIFGAEVGFSDPTTYQALAGAHATVSKDDPADTGDIRLILYEGYGGGYGGGYGELGSSSWFALTDTPTVISFTLPAYVFDATGISLRWEVRTQVSVNAIVTGAAPFVVSPVPATATATGTANNPAISIRQPAGNATAASTANNPSIKIQPHPSSASATGTANNAALAISVDAGSASAVGTAYVATVNAAGHTNVNADVASATGTAFNASIAISIPAGNATGTSTANNAVATNGTNVNPTSATATGVANDASIRISIPAGSATATGTANNATSSTTIQTVANASAATAGAIAYDATIRIRVNAGVALASGIAYNTRGAPATAVLTVDGKWTAGVVVEPKMRAEVTVE